MIQIIDPRKGDAEDDASSPKRRSLLALAGSLVAEISLPKLIVSWVLLIGLPSFVLGVGPLVVSAWVGKVSTHASAFFTGIWYVVIVLVLALLGWLGGRPAFRLFENSFWSLQALGIQPAYAICREGLRHLLEGLLPSGIATAKRNTIRAAGAAMSGSPRLGLPRRHGRLRAGWGVSPTSRHCTFSCRSHLRMRSSSWASTLPSRPSRGASRMRQWTNRVICSPSRPALRMVESGASPTSRISMS
jgi:hypothetical protein